MTFIPLNESTILMPFAKTPLHHHFQLHLLSSIDSTNLFLKNYAHRTDQSIVDICCAETQTQGRGRFGRSWYSPVGENIYCSSRWYLPISDALAGLSLVISLAIHAALTALCHLPHLAIKWPNDVLWQDKKLCGTLIELIPTHQQCMAVIIGIGINVNSRSAHLSPIEKPWCTLSDITERMWDRNFIITQLMQQLYQYIHRFKQKGLLDFMTEWQQVDYLYSKKIIAMQGEHRFSGIAAGINEWGQLHLLDETGVSHYLSAGETSLQQSRRSSNQ